MLTYSEQIQTKYLSLNLTNISPQDSADEGAEAEGSSREEEQG